jgi:hypothetical protein
MQEMRIVEVPVYDFTTHQRSIETRRVRCLPACLARCGPALPIWQACISAAAGLLEM